MSQVLVVDDEEGFTAGMTEYLRLQGHTADAAESLSTARTSLAKSMPDVLLLDLMLPDGSGLELLDAFGDEQPKKIIIITGHAGVKSLIGGMAGDNVEYMKKPIEPRDILGILNSIDGPRRHPDSSQAGDPHFGLLFGDSDAMRAVYEKIRKVAKTDSTVFIQGESGTGKELVAEALHRLSHRSGRFVPVNCGGLTQDLVSSQLFGHEKGSFTGADRRHAGFFEQAKDGTLFLDEITEMPLAMQTHLLRTLEDGNILRVGSEREMAVNARLVTATNRNPAEAVRDGALREDLYFRLRVFPIEVPPLRDRREDIIALATQFLGELNEKSGTSKVFTPQALERLQAHTWPGNVRELKHTVHRAYISSDYDAIDVPAQFDDNLPHDIEGIRAGRTIADVERDLILRTLKKLDGNKKAAAASLGVSPRTLYTRLKEYEADGLDLDM